MAKTINAKELRASLPTVVKRVQQGESFLVVYRSRPAFRIVSVSIADIDLGALEDDPLFRADAVGTSSDGLSSTEHDELLYRSK